MPSELTHGLRAVLAGCVVWVLVGDLSPPATTPKKGRPFVLPSLIENKPLYRASITSSESFREASALNATTELRRKGNRIELVVDDIHEVVLVRY